MVMAPREGLAVVVSGPSGCGKTTLIKHLMLRTARSHFSISATTRPPRGEEVDGVDYHFMDRDQFLELRNSGGMLEWAKVHDEFYGSPRKEVLSFLAEGYHVFLDIDVQGGLQVAETLGERAWLLYVLPPDRETLEERLRGRGTEDEERLRTRLRNARRELAKKFEYDYIVVNDDRETALETLLSIIRAERCRAERLKETGS